MSFFNSSFVAAASSISIRILGFLRDMLFAQVLGTGAAANAFLAVFRTSNAIRRILSEGGLNPAFIPLFARLRAESEDQARSFAQDAFSVFAIALFAGLACLEIFTSFFALIMFPGLSEEATHLAIFYARLCFPMMAGISLAACLGALLNAERRIAFAAMAPNIINIVTIIALLCVDHTNLYASVQAGWVAAAAGLSGFIHLALLIWAVRRQMPWFRFQFRIPHLSRDVKEFLKGTLPTLLIVGTSQLSVIIATVAASFLPSGISWLYYAERLFQFPLGFVGAVTGYVLLPELAARIAASDLKGCIQAQNRSMEIALIFSIPAALALYMLAEPIIRILFERHAFGAHDTYATAIVLQGMALGLPIGAIGKVLSQTVFVGSSLKAALTASISSMIVTLITSCVLVLLLGVQGISFGINAGLLTHMICCIFILQQKALWKPDKQFYRKCATCLLSSAVLGFYLLFFLSFFGKVNTVMLLWLCVSSVVVYMGAAFLTGTFSLEEVKKMKRS